MSATNYTPIYLYNSGTATNTPSAANLGAGELAINYADGKLFYKDGSAAVQVIAWKTTPTTAGGTGLTSYTAGDLPYYASGSALSKLGIGTSGYVLQSNGSAPTWVAQSTLSVGTATNATNTAITDNTSSSATWYPTIVSATTGNLPQTTSSTKLSFVPSTGTLTATSHAGAWAGSTIGTTYGGTGLTSFTANGVVYASSTSALATGSGLLFDGTNLGIGVTPSTWVVGTGGHALEFSNAGSIWNYSSTSGINLSQNVYYNGAYYYKNTGATTIYAQGSGGHYWYSSASGTGGTTFTPVQTMYLDINGNLTISGATATKASGLTWANPSDTRIKDNQVLYTKGLTELNQIAVKTWIFNGLGGSIKGEKGLGVIADEIINVLPDTVDTYSAKLNSDDTENTDIKRFNANEIIWLLVTSTQELSAQVIDLQNRLKLANIP